MQNKKKFSFSSLDSNSSKQSSYNSSESENQKITKETIKNQFDTLLQIEKSRNSKKKERTDIGRTLNDINKCFDEDNSNVQFIEKNNTTILEQEQIESEGKNKIIFQIIEMKNIQDAVQGQSSNTHFIVKIINPKTSDFFIYDSNFNRNVKKSEEIEGCFSQNKNSIGFQREPISKAQYNYLINSQNKQILPFQLQGKESCSYFAEHFVKLANKYYKENADNNYEDYIEYFKSPIFNLEVIQEILNNFKPIEEKTKQDCFSILDKKIDGIKSPIYEYFLIGNKHVYIDKKLKEKEFYHAKFEDVKIKADKIINVENLKQYCEEKKQKIQTKIGIEL